MVWTGKIVPLRWRRRCGCKVQCQRCQRARRRLWFSAECGGDAKKAAADELLERHLTAEQLQCLLTVLVFTADHPLASDAEIRAMLERMPN
jgi:hypothetical protein